MSSSQTEYNAQTRFFTIATAGHVDHGKTSLLRSLTGQDPDRLKEEKERQMTTDLGFAYMYLPSNTVVGFVDVPGHGKFLKNMLAGVGGIDLALLVVAADEGPMPQTRQHVRILSLLGVSKAIVAISKIDLVEEDGQIELVQEETEKLLAAHGIELLSFCPLSSSTGAGIEELKNTFSKVFEELPRKQSVGSLLLPVDRVFSKTGFGTVITGTLVSGKLAVGDQIYIEPGDISARVRRLETHGKTVEIANPGQRVACNLVVKDGEKLKRGFVLSSSAINPVKSLIVSLYDRPRLLKDSLAERLSDQPIRLYHGTAEYHGFVRWVEDRHELSHLDNEAAGFQLQGQSGIGFIALQDDAVVSAQDKFVIRLTDDTIYGGVILLRDRPRWLTKKELLQLAEPLMSASFEDALLRFLDEAPQLMMKEDQLDAILPEEGRVELLTELKKNGRLVNLGDFVLSSSSREALSQKLQTQMGKALEMSEQFPDGVPLEGLRQLLQPKLERTAFQSLIQEETDKGLLLRRADKLSLPGRQNASATSSAQTAAESQILEQLSRHWCLEIDELASQSGLDLKLVKTSVQALTKSGRVVIVSYDFVGTVEKINGAHRVLAEIWNKKRSIAPTDFRESLETTRKYAMALLQYFDDQKITRRLDSGRVLLKGPPA